MERRQFIREFKVEAVRLVRERVVSVAQEARDLDIHENMLRRWAKAPSADPAQAFPGHGQAKPEQIEIERLRCEVAKLRAERDILKKAAAFFAREARQGSFSSRSTGMSGRWRGSANRWTYPARAFTPGCDAGRARGRKPTKS